MKNSLASILLAAFAVFAMAVGTPLSSAIKIGSNCDVVVIDDAAVCVSDDEPDHQDEDEDGLLISLTPIDLELG